MFGFENISVPDMPSMESIQESLPEMPKSVKEFQEAEARSVLGTANAMGSAAGAMLPKSVEDKIKKSKVF